MVSVHYYCNRPFAASHSRGTKPPCWRAKVALGQDKPKAYIILNGNLLCFSCPSATLVSSTAVLYQGLGLSLFPAITSLWVNKYYFLGDSISVPGVQMVGSGRKIRVRYDLTCSPLSKRLEQASL